MIDYQLVGFDFFLQMGKFVTCGELASRLLLGHCSTKFFGHEKGDFCSDGFGRARSRDFSDGVLGGIAESAGRVCGTGFSN